MQAKGYHIPVIRLMPQREHISIKRRASGKVGVVLLLALLLLLSANVWAQRVSYSGKAQPAQLFSIITEQTGYKFFYPNESLAGAKPVAVSLKDVPLEKALKIILEGLPLEFVIQGKTVFIRKKTEKKSFSVQAGETSQDGDEPSGVRGTVTDEQGVPLPGITIMTIHGHRGSQTNEQGVFFCPAEKGDSLLFRSINYETLRLPAQFGVQMNVKMKQQVSNLSAVTVYNTGYQVLSKERATGSFAKPDMEVFQRRVGLGSVTDVLGRLDGQVAGLVINAGPNNMKGRYPGNGVVTRKALVRGKGTVLLDVEPLYVINGMISPDFSAVNPDDIEDITLLKDAAAAAIYGARAANGVIVVTTREGKKNQRLTINYSGSATMQDRPDWPHDPMLNSREYIQVAKELFDPVTYPWSRVSSGYVAPHDLILYNRYRGLISEEQANKSLDSLANIDNKSQVLDLLYRPAITTNHTISASGGTNVYSFLVSLGYTSMQGTNKGDKSNSYKINFTQSINAGKRISITLNTSLINTINSSRGQLSISNAILPYLAFKDANGNNVNMPYMTGYGDSIRRDYQARSRINLDYYPLEDLNYLENSRNNLSLSASARVSVKLWKGLRFEGTYGYQKYPGTYDIYNDNQSLSMRQQLLSLTVAPTVDATPKYYLPLTGGYYNTSNNDQRNWTVRNQLIYEIQPRQQRDYLTIQAGQEAQDQYGYNSSTTLYGYNRALGTYPVLDYATLSKGVPGTVTGYGYLNGNFYQVNKTVTRFYSYFALANYSFNRKYDIDLSWRQDQSSLFGADVSSQNKPVWSLGGKWRIDGEPFLEPVKWINSLAVRATCGILGNSPYVGAATLYDVLGANAQLQSGGIGGDALRINSPANRRLAWESVKTINAGIDFALFNNRINGSIEGYNKTTIDLISNLPANPFTGYARTTGNLGKAVNKGIEVTLAAENIRRKDFSWVSRVVFSYNKNKLVSWGKAGGQLSTVDTWLGFPRVEGYPLDAMFAYRFAGLDNMGDPQIKLADKTVTKNPAVAQTSDLVYMGVMQPRFNGGLTNTFNYKGISLSVNAIYSLGNVMRRDVSMTTSGRLSNRAYFGGGNVREDFLHRWKNPGDEAFTNVPSYVSSTSVDNNRRNIGYYRLGDINVVSAAYIKIRDVSLSYDLQPVLIKRLGIQRVNVFAVANNFMIWKANHYGIDPEYHQDPLNGGLTLPVSMHSYSVGMRVTL